LLSQGRGWPRDWSGIDQIIVPCPSKIISAHSDGVARTGLAQRR
jgi:hypothetical protein